MSTSPDRTQQTTPDVASEKDVEKQGGAPAPEVTPVPPAGGPPPFPEGGREAWTVVFGAWLAVLVSFGFLNAFGGTFQQYYKTHQLAGESPSNISWIGSFQSFCMYFGGSVFGSLFDRFGAPPLMVIGGVAFAFACMMQSISKQYWHFLLSQGLLGGIALSCLFTPAYSAAQHWFLKRRGFALGLVTSGSSVGGVIWPIMANRLIRQVGFGWALRICGFIALAICLVAATITKGRLPPRKDARLLSLDLFLLPGYTILCIGMFFVVIGIFFLLFYLPSYGALYGFDSNMTFYSISVLNAASFFGRIIPGFIADKWGRFNMLGSTALACSVLVLCSIRARSEASILVIGVLYGFMSGNVFSLQGACVPPFIAGNPSKIGVAVGQLLSMSAVAALMGPPIAGWLIAAGGFPAAQIFAGVTVAVGAGCILVSRQFLSKPGHRWII